MPTPATNPLNIAMIGCGLMGHGLAKNLRLAGHSVSILKHPGNQPTDDLGTLGAKLVDDLATLVRAKDAVFLVLPGSKDVEAVVTEENGLLTCLEPGMLVIDATSAEPEETLKIAAAVQALGCAYVDAPMTRTPKEAEEGRLNVLLGGSDADVARATPIIEAYAENIYHGGPISAGHRLKLLHNFVSIGQAVIIAEAVAAAKRGGVDTGVLSEVLATGGAGGVALQRMRPYIENQDTTAFKFAIKNAAKDLGYYTAMAEAMGAQHVAADAVHHVLVSALANGGETKVMPELIDVLDR